MAFYGNNIIALVTGGTLVYGADAVAPASAVTKCADTATILDEWQETFTIKRLTTIYNASRIAVETWTQIGTFLGDWQPVSGSTMRNEAGLSIKSESLIIGTCDVDIEENDRVERADGANMYVNYVREYEDHITVYLKRTIGSN